ncbi:shikimate dehydrogenase [Prosthecochloris sp. GSB1]|uniref:shikimate dehydrogenase n=1 Tax=Prosthecochloris sp. GSB1 TaxID=281093 RepID=UPI000B8C8EAF|nr:shikimate dehydrogenase [Prosthecochloris sp. GSB1]ASQ90874.1 shikimate dehydrogenase [Prosthecochloris sp. GSB1]
MPERRTPAGKILGLIGRNVDYSYSPFIHNTAAEMLRLPFYYTIFNIAAEELVPTALEGARALGIAGFNVTIPYKRTVVACMDELSPEAVATGAVNTIVNRNGRLEGHNTDIAGVSDPLLRYIDDIKRKPAGIFGNGGAAMAAVEALRRFLEPSDIRMFVRDRVRGKKLETRLNAGNPGVPVSVHSTDDFTALGECSLVINATPVGTLGVTAGFDNCILPEGTGAIHGGQVVFDMVYNPKDTPLLNMARKNGAVTVPGIEMLLAQAAKSFALWTGNAMPLQHVRKYLLELLESGETER